MYAISTRDLTRRFGKLEAVENLDLKIPSGSLFGLIGPNGAGKTTTFKDVGRIVRTHLRRNPYQ